MCKGEGGGEEAWVCWARGGTGDEGGAGVGVRGEEGGMWEGDPQVTCWVVKGEGDLLLAPSPTVPHLLVATPVAVGCGGTFTCEPFPLLVYLRAELLFLAFLWRPQRPLGPVLHPPSQPQHPLPCPPPRCAPSTFSPPATRSLCPYPIILSQPLARALFPLSSGAGQGVRR